MKSTLKFLFVVFLVFTQVSYAQFSGQSKTGITAATFLSIEVGARAKSMGGAFVALANDVSAIYWNPSGIALIPKNAVMFSHSEWLADVNFDFAGVSIPIGSFGTLGASVTAINMPDMEVTTVFEPEGTGELFSASDLAITLTYARKLTDRFAIGANFKYIQEKIFHMTAKTGAVDFGTVFRTNFNNMILGFSISNFGGNLKLSGIDTQVEHDIAPNEFGNNDRIFANLETQPFQLPLTFRVGVAMDVIKTENNQLTIAVDGIVPNDNAQYVNVGGEYSFSNLISLRAGYKTLFLKDSEEGLSLGAGLQSKLVGSSRFSFDYAYGDFGILNNIQEFSLTIYF
jgi:long-subunit fatty acid transport protein